VEEIRRAIYQLASRIMGRPMLEQAFKNIDDVLRKEAGCTAEYYTPRSLIRAIVRVVKPKIGERIYDGAVGSAGFLCESFEYMKSKGHLRLHRACDAGCWGRGGVSV
jgi:type I restriction-modification system DNA methylase subunit